MLPVFVKVWSFQGDLWFLVKLVGTLLQQHLFTLSCLFFLASSWFLRVTETQISLAAATK